MIYLEENEVLPSEKNNDKNQNEEKKTDDEQYKWEAYSLIAGVIAGIIALISLAVSFDSQFPSPAFKTFFIVQHSIMLLALLLSFAEKVSWKTLLTITTIWVILFVFDLMVL